MNKGGDEHQLGCVTLEVWLLRKTYKNIENLTQNVRGWAKKKWQMITYFAGFLKSSLIHPKLCDCDKTNYDNGFWLSQLYNFNKN